MTSLTKKVECLEEKFGTNEKIAETLSDTAKKAVKMQEMFAETFVTLLKSNKDIRKVLADLLDELDRSYTKSFMKRFGSWIGGLVLLIVGALIKSLFDKF